MTARLYPSGHLNETGDIENCWCGWRGPLKSIPHCERCTAEKKRGTHHGLDYKHEGQCAAPGCEAEAVNYAKPGRKPKYGYHCPAHAVEGPEDRVGERVTGGAMAHIINDEDRERMREASKELAALMPKDEPVAPATWIDASTAYVPSRRSSDAYRVDVAIDGTAVCSCPGFEHHGHCYHADLVQKELSMTATREETALAPINLMPPRTVLPSAEVLFSIRETAAMAVAGAIALPEGIKTKEQAAAIMLYGWELGIPPMSALNELYIVKGKVSPSAKVMAGLVANREADSRLTIVELTDQKCTLRFRRPSRALDVEYTVTWDDIKRANLAGGTNATYPKDRLTYHCMKRILRVYAPDLIFNLGSSMTSAALSTDDDDDPNIIESQGYTVDRTTGEVVDDNNRPAPADENAQPPADWLPLASKPRPQDIRTPMPTPISDCEHEPQMDLEGRTVCTRCGIVMVDA